MTAPIYRSDPDRAPDTDFVPGELSHLVAGNHGRLLDSRRTPITIVAVTPAIGAFVVEIKAFEDTGARWELPLPAVTRFQFTHDAARTDTAELARAAAKFDHDMTIDCDPAARQETEHRITAERRTIHPEGDPARQHHRLRCGCGQRRLGRGDRRVTRAGQDFRGRPLAVHAGFHRSHASSRQEGLTSLIGRRRSTERPNCSR